MQNLNHLKMITLANREFQKVCLGFSCVSSETEYFMYTQRTENTLNRKRINQNQSTHEKSYNNAIWYQRCDFIFAVSVPSALKILVWEKAEVRKRKVPMLSQV